MDPFLIFFLVVLVGPLLLISLVAVVAVFSGDFEREEL